MKRSLLVLLFLLISSFASAQYDSLFRNSVFLLREPVDGCTTLEEWLYKNTELPSDAGNDWKFGEVFLFVKVDSVSGKLNVLRYHNARIPRASMIREAILKTLMAPPVMLKEGNSYNSEYGLFCPNVPSDCKMADASNLAAPAVYGESAPGDYSSLVQLIVKKTTEREKEYVVICPLITDREIFGKNKSETNKQGYQPQLQSMYEKLLDGIVEEQDPRVIMRDVKYSQGIANKVGNIDYSVSLRNVISGRTTKEQARIVVHVDSTGSIDLNRYYNYAVMNINYAPSSTALYFLKEINPKFTPAKDKTGRSVGSDIILDIKYQGYKDPSATAVRNNVKSVESVKPADGKLTDEEMMKVIEDYDRESERKK